MQAGRRRSGGGGLYVVVTFPRTHRPVWLGSRAEAEARRQKAQAQWRGSSWSRGYDARWQAERAVHLAANPLCVACLALEGRPVPATVLDHKVPHKGDPGLFKDPANRQGLCADHHNGEKKRREGLWARGLLPVSALDMTRPCPD